MARVSRKRRNSGEMASDALWIISFKCVVKGYQDCRFDVKEGEDFRVLKKIDEKGRAFRIVQYTDASTPFSLKVTFNCS